ncbi:MAG: methyltransferase domain-containing protein [Candidatus Scalindua sp.]|jgi:hypothetical protein|nr:methyltransferase domain-containing protein [Candidatus Scalindua sp.]
MTNYKEIKHCRICGNNDLFPILNLGEQALTGIFPKSRDQRVASAPLELVKCQESGSGGGCGLVQLKHSFGLSEMYGENYGYRSGLNRSMVEHLRNKVKTILSRISVSPGDLVIDIGSNDSTLLQAYPHDLVLVGVDPTGSKFGKYYPDHVQLIPDFFSSHLVDKHCGGKKARIITSIAMFYDLEVPLDFVEQIYHTLSDDGVWVFEQSYLLSMLESNSYDTVCHEHLEYYRLKQIKWIMDKVGFKIIDVELNMVNGGSFSVTVAKQHSPYPEAVSIVDELLNEEIKRGLDTEKPYLEFKQRIYRHREQLLHLLEKSKHDGKKILGYGASTKGNVVLQFCNLTEDQIPFIAEVNSDKFGSYTPGNYIPIISEEEARAMKPDYFMVLPWHFKENIIKRERRFLESGGALLFYLPQLELVNS